VISFGAKKFGPKEPVEAEEQPEQSAPAEDDSLAAMAGKKAAGRVLAALEGGDAGALDKALRAHYEACH
jgi:hypothetical protein